MAATSRRISVRSTTMGRRGPSSGDIVRWRLRPRGVVSDPESDRHTPSSYSVGTASAGRSSGRGGREGPRRSVTNDRTREPDRVRFEPTSAAPSPRGSLATSKFQSDVRGTSMRSRRAAASARVTGSVSRLEAAVCHSSCQPGRASAASVKLAVTHRRAAVGLDALACCCVVPVERLHLCNIHVESHRIGNQIARLADERLLCLSDSWLLSGITEGVGDSTVIASRRDGMIEGVEEAR